MSKQSPVPEAMNAHATSQAQRGPSSTPAPAAQERVARWRSTWPWALALIVLGGALVFYRLGEGPIDVYDEGLYGRHAQSALEHHVYLYAVDTRGSFPTGDVKFSKPPLSIWVTAASFALFGPSLFALRLPFALATLASALLAFAWGLRLERGRVGAWLGFVWGSLFLASHGAYHFGRTATIDTLLLAFVMLALYAHARAIEQRGLRSLLFCLLAGSGVSLAFLTKQLVCVLAAAPIAVVELARMRRERIWRPLLRATISLGLPLLVAAGWLAMLWQKLGPATREVLWSHAIVRRVRGFDGLHHHNYLNRIAEQLDLDAAPFAWPLGILGLVLFVAERTRKRERSADAWLLFGTFACSWLAFDVGSRAILPWYAYTFLMPLAFGNALLLTRACAALLARDRARLDRLGVVYAAGGAAALVAITTDATRTLFPAPLVAASASAFVAAVALASSPRQLKRRSLYALGTALVLTLAGVLTRERYAYSEPDAASVLGSALSELGARYISIDRRAGFHDYTRVTFFGVKASVGEAPWTAAAKRKHKRVDARIEAEVLPREANVAAGQQLLRAAGMFAVQGAPTQHPFDSEHAERALSRGALTYEAEDLASERYDTLAHRSGASGGAVRRMAGWPRRRPASFKLAYGTLSELPSGNYQADFSVRAEHSFLSGARLGEVSIRNAGSPIASRAIHSSATDSGDDHIVLKFSLLKPSRISVTIRYDQGTIAFDRVTISRQ